MSLPGTVEYFNEELVRFRDAMCDSGNSVEKIDLLFCGLFFVAVRTKEDNLPAWESICVEWPRRRILMLRKCLGIA